MPVENLNRMELRLLFPDAFGVLGGKTSSEPQRTAREFAQADGLQ